MDKEIHIPKTPVLEKTLESPLDCKEIQPVRSEGDQPWDFFGRNDAKAETPILWPPHAKSWLIGKDSDARMDWGQEEKGTTEDEMARWHHWLDGRESQWTPGVGDGQGGLVCCDSWGHRESDTTEQLNWTEYTPDIPYAVSSFNFSPLHFLHCCCCCYSVTQSCPTLCNPMDCSTPGFPVRHYHLEFAQTYIHESVMPSNHLILCHPLFFLPSVFPSIRVFSNELVLHIRRSNTGASDSSSVVSMNIQG